MKMQSINEKILKFIIDYITFHGYSPSIREICSWFNLLSNSTIHNHLKDKIDAIQLTLECEPK